MDKSQYRVAQVLTASTTPPVGDPNTDPDNNNVAGENGSNDTDPNANNNSAPTGTEDKDKPPTNQPVIVVMDKPSSKEEEKNKGMVSPSELFYYGTMTAIIIALLAMSYNSIKTANVAKV